MTATVFPAAAGDAIRFGLYEPTLHYAGAAWDADVLAPWVAENRATVAALHRVGDAGMASVALEPADLWALYALSRVAELLILPHQPPADGPDWLPLPAYRQFIGAFGATSPQIEGFHPFLHEIVRVEAAADRSEPPAVVAEWWPSCVVGDLLILRAGVTVRAGAGHLDPVTAAGSALYWASRRRYRPARDLSHGWGSNSQWRTAFRRDYRLGDRLLYNADAALDPGSQQPCDPGLLRHRCSTLIDHGDDEWVWDGHHSEPLPAGTGWRANRKVS